MIRTHVYIYQAGFVDELRKIPREIGKCFMISINKWL